MQKTPVSIQIISVLTTIVYYFTAVFSLLGTLVSVAILLGLLNTNDIILNVDMPVEVNFAETGKFMFDGESTDVQIVEAIGKVQFKEIPTKLARLLAVVLLILFSAFYWLVYLFYSFIRNVKSGKVFKEENFKLLRKLGFSLIGFWFLLIIIMQLFHYFIVMHFDFENVQITANSRWFAGVFVSGLFLLVLSDIFIKGRELEEENELTI